MDLKILIFLFLGREGLFQKGRSLLNAADASPRRLDMAGSTLPSDLIITPKYSCEVVTGMGVPSSKKSGENLLIQVKHGMCAVLALLKNRP